MIRRCLLAALLVLLAGCAATFPETRTDAAPAQVQFRVLWGATATVTIFDKPVECGGMHIVAMGATGLDKTIYLPRAPYLTFAVEITKTAERPNAYARVMYSVPLQTGDVRITVNPGPSDVHTAIEVRDGQDWRPAARTFKRAAPAAFPVGSYCAVDPSFAS